MQRYLSGLATSPPAGGGAAQGMLGAYLAIADKDRRA
jgi:hypothetical protein